MLEINLPLRYLDNILLKFPLIWSLKKNIDKTWKLIEIGENLCPS